MKNAKDYIEEISPNIWRSTSLAYLLTPEGLNNPIVAALLRESIADETDEDFKQAFDGATKAEAALYLEQWELCYMGQWGAPELVRAIVSSDGRNEALALRAVSMAQSAGELSEVFDPREGVQWAMARGYLIDGCIRAWCGYTPGNYGHPSNPLSPADAPDAKVEAVTPAPVPKSNKLRTNTLDPAIDKAIEQAGSVENAPVWLKLKELALAGESPFTGAISGDALCYTSDNDQHATLTKNAVCKRLAKRRQSPIAADRCRLAPIAATLLTI